MKKGSHELHNHLQGVLDHAVSNATALVGCRRTVDKENVAELERKIAYAIQCVNDAQTELLLNPVEY